MNNESKIIIPHQSFKKAKDNTTKIDELHCCICNTETNQRTKRFDNTRSIFYHLHEFHGKDPRLKFALEILNSVSIAIEVGMLK